MGQHTLDRFGGPSFDPGDRVVDRTPADPSADKPETMIVIDPDVGRADTVTVDGQSVAALNPDYPAADRVVEIAFRSYLDAYVPPWTDWAATTLKTTLRAYCEEWGVEYRTYYYPESRLMPAAESR